MTRLNTSQWLEHIVNQYISLDPEAISNLADMKGQVISVEVLGLNKQYFIFPQEDRLVIETSSEVEADTIIRGMPSALLKLAMQDDTAPLMLSGEIEVVGDVRLGRAFKKCLANIEIDWEEHFSKMMGDVTANKLFKTFSQLSEWTKNSVSSLKEDISEYLQEESRDVVTGAELSDFNDKVDQLRDDVDRLTAKLKLNNTKK